MFGKLTLSCAFLLAAFPSYTQSDTTYHPCYFPHKSFSIGMSYGYASDLKASGINLRGYYNLTHALCFGPEVSYFNRGDESLIDVNIVGHYIFDTKVVGIYPVIGANYSMEERYGHTAGIAEPTLHKKNAYALVTGAGIHRNLKWITIFGEYSHHFGAISDNIINAGLLIMLKKNHEKEN